MNKTWIRIWHQLLARAGNRWRSPSSPSSWPADSARVLRSGARAQTPTAREISDNCPMSQNNLRTRTRTGFCGWAGPEECARVCAVLQQDTHARAQAAARPGPEPPPPSPQLVNWSRPNQRFDHGTIRLRSKQHLYLSSWRSFSFLPVTDRSSASANSYVASVTSWRTERSRSKIPTWQKILIYSVLLKNSGETQFITNPSDEYLKLINKSWLLFCSWKLYFYKIKNNDSKSLLYN